MKLNGWHRIGIVLSILWMIVICSLGFRDDKKLLTFKEESYFELPIEAFNVVEITRAEKTKEFNCTQSPEILALPAHKREEAAKQYQQALVMSLVHGPQMKELELFSPEWRARAPKVAQENAAKLGCKQDEIELKPASFEQHFELNGILNYAFFPVLIGWILAFIFVYCFRWVRAGFSGSKRDS